MTSVALLMVIHFSMFFPMSIWRARMSMRYTLLEELGLEMPEHVHTTACMTEYNKTKLCTMNCIE